MTKDELDKLFDGMDMMKKVSAACVMGIAAIDKVPNGSKGDWLATLLDLHRTAAQLDALKYAERLGDQSPVIVSGIISMQRHYERVRLRLVNLSELLT